MRKYLLPLLFCQLSATFLYANDEDRKGTITGKVTTSDGQAAEAVSITQQGTGNGAITDRKGNYQAEHQAWNLSVDGILHRA